MKISRNYEQQGSSVFAAGFVNKIVRKEEVSFLLKKYTITEIIKIKIKKLL